MTSENVVDDYFVERIENVSFANGERRVLNGLMVHTATLHWYTGLGFAAGLAIGSLA